MGANDALLNFSESKSAQGLDQSLVTYRKDAPSFFLSVASTKTFSRQNGGPKITEQASEVVNQSGTDFNPDTVREILQDITYCPATGECIDHRDVRDLVDPALIEADTQQ